MKTTAPERSAADYIAPLNMNGLHGRVLHMPAPKDTKREILVVYGHHSSLERWWGLTQNFNLYGAVTMPDLPGFGGMDSLYKIGLAPTLDNLADYLASFVTLRYKRRRFSIVGISFGFLVATRMIQRYPELAKRIDFFVSAIGFAHYDDFTFSRPRYLAYRYAAQLFSLPVIAQIFRAVALNSLVIRTFYARTNNAKHKFDGASRELHQKLIAAEIGLWHNNEIRTYMKTSVEMLTVDNCRKQIDLPVWHVSAQFDNYFDNALVEQHMRVIFREYHEAKTNLVRHAPSVIADAKEAASLIPLKLRRALAQADDHANNRSSKSAR